MPNTLTQNAQIIDEAVADIKDEIALKGVTVPDPCPITTIPSLIQRISGGGSQDTQQLINLIEDDESFSLIIPAEVVFISDYTCFKCTNLTSVVIPPSVEYIGNYAFAFCTNLINVSISAESEGIGISDSAFQGCASLASIDFANVISIGDSAFYECSSLTSVILSQSINIIPAAAFYSCTNLVNVTIPASVTFIGSSAFRSCTSLANVDLTKFTNPNAIPALANSNAFSLNASSRKFIVANAEMKAAFSAATNWSTYASAFITAEEAAQNA